MSQENLDVVKRANANEVLVSGDAALGRGRSARGFRPAEIFLDRDEALRAAGLAE
jgi:hypothetical protein